MLEFNPQKLAALCTALTDFQKRPLNEASAGLLSSLGYKSDKTAEFGSKPEQFIAAVEEATHSTFNRDKAHVSRWKQCAFLFQLTNDEIPSLAMGQQALSTDTKLARSLIESFVFLAIELQGEGWSRTDLAAIARELNRRFPMPAIVIFKHGELLSLVVIDRRANLKDAAKDVLDSRITVIKDVRINNPHRAHLDILAGLALENLGDKRRPTNFRELYDAWIAALSTQALNKRFYTELAWWYFWAVKQVAFPPGGGDNEAKRNSVAVIRLLTRLIFAWFIKEKGLIPEDLFDPAQLKTLLKSDPSSNGEDSTYYLAILQNLFFASLNVEMGADRKWAADGGGLKSDRLIHSLYRHKEMFRDPDHALNEYFAKIPFLNGGLFECLDRELTERDFQRNPELKALAVKEGNGYVLRVDGFSRRKDAQPIVPNKIFFGGEAGADLNADLGTKGKRFDVHGLIDIFGRYKFTVEENTPVEEEVALDPELLGKVFENLLASYNEDTQATARKQSGSFYTPREVVDYMVDEALIAYFERHLNSPRPQAGEGQGERVRTTARPVNEVLDLGAGPGELDLAPSAPVGRVSPSGRNPTSAVAALENVGLRDEAANPTYATRDDNAIDTKLRRLLSYSTESNDFSLAETTKLIAAIESLKILDPACGSGAFPMGVLQKLVHVLKKLDPSNELWKTQNRAPLAAQLAEAKKIPDPSLREAKVEEAESALAKFDRDFANAKHADYTRKLYLIEKCIHGVDIQPIAVQIAKLRFFIALVVSQEVDKTKDNWGVTALPNLETKIVAADSLTPIREVKTGMTENYQLGHDAIKAIEVDLHDASERYFSARTTKTKRKYREVIQNLRDKLASELEHSGFSTAKAQQLVHWNPFDQNAAADFFDPEWMFQLAEGFDITIGNPPYVRHEEIKHLKDGLKAHYDCYTGTADLYVYFYERSIKLLKPHGAFAFITSNKWYRAKYGEKLRDWMNCNTRLRRIIDFGDEAVFTAIAYPTIVIATRREKPINPPPAGDMVRALNWSQNHPVETFPAVFAAESFTVPQAKLKKESWQLETQANRLLLEQIIGTGIPLRKYVSTRVYRGITTGFNDAFVIDGATRSKLISECQSSDEIIKPYMRGQDVARWSGVSPDKWIIFTRKRISIRDYPAVLKYLEAFKEALTPKPENWNDKNDGEWPGRKAGSYEWYEIQDNIAYWKEFESAKIVSTKVSIEPTFMLDNDAHFLGNTAYFIPVSEAPLFLLALLNSTVSTYYARGRFVGKQNNGMVAPSPNGIQVPKWR
ncbi:MAG: Eco57I restriction-modification methylase domain-containing protein [Sulfuricellaceae bacterium]|nr:Eco57I restriction-modification methylase domain-containing protein [Sulfuricellaceae bacterium]